MLSKSLWIVLTMTFLSTNIDCDLFHIIEGNSNLSIGLFSSSLLRNALMTPSYTYFPSAYDLIIPPIPNTPFEKNFKPLQKIVWLRLN